MTADKRIVAPERSGDDTLEVSLRPKRLADFVGQQQARENLSIFIDAAKARAEALDHVLFHGPPGLGKTTLAQIVARELGVNFRSTSGPVLAKAPAAKRALERFVLEASFCGRVACKGGPARGRGGSRGSDWGRHCVAANVLPTTASHNSSRPQHGLAP